MSKMPSPHFQMESWATVFSIFSFINCGIVYIWHIYIYISLDKRTWFTVLFLSQRELYSVRNIDFYLVGAPTSICHFFCPSVRRARYFWNRTSSNHSFWCTCVNDISRWFFACLFGAAKKQKIAQNEK